MGNSQDVRAACVAVMLGLALLDWQNPSSVGQQMTMLRAEGKIA